MKTVFKNMIKKTPPMKWLLGRLNKLENAQKEETFKHNEKLIQLEKLHKEETEKLIEQLHDLQRQLKRQETSLKLEMNYLYHKGLNPGEYEVAIKEWYKSRTGKTLNLKNPQTFNEKIQWMKLYDSTPIKTRLADKYLVREWVAEKIGEKYLVPLLGVYNKFDDIDFDKLPNKFVLKANHGSGWNIIVKDKAKLNMTDAKKKFDTWMNHNYAFNLGLELHYLNIPPKIIIEKYLGGELEEYRFLCFSDEVKFIYVNKADPNPARYKRTLFTPDWQRMNVTIKHPAADYKIPKPKTLEKMLELATKLSQRFPHVRVDFYNANGKIYFGEMTFTFGSGIQTIMPEEFGLEMGSWIKLPEKSEIPRLK